MTVAEQVISVFCGVRGYLDDIDLKDVAEFEGKIIQKCKSDKPEIIETILSSGKLDEDKEKLLVEVISKLKGDFKSCCILYYVRNNDDFTICARDFVSCLSGDKVIFKKNKVKIIIIARGKYRESN